MSMIVVDLIIAWVQGETDARGCGFRGLFGETPVLGFFTNGSVLSTELKIWLTSTPDNMTSTGSVEWLVFSFALSVVSPLPPLSLFVPERLAYSALGLSLVLLLLPCLFSLVAL